MAVLNLRYRIAPSTATMFTSELPSNFTTPVATPGTNTPIPGQPGHPMHHPAGHGVNPLLLAATRNVMQPNQGHHLQVPGHATPVMDAAPRERPISQGRTSIKNVKLPDYLPEWKSVQWSGFEEAAFAGAQVLAGLVYPNGSKDPQEKFFLTRTEFNEEGPPGIASYCLGGPA
jgi:actin-related protein 9